MASGELLTFWINAISQGKDAFLLLFITGVGFSMLEAFARLIRFGVKS